MYSLQVKRTLFAGKLLASYSSHMEHRRGPYSERCLSNSLDTTFLSCNCIYPVKTRRMHSCLNFHGKRRKLDTLKRSVYIVDGFLPMPLRPTKMRLRQRLPLEKSCLIQSLDFLTIQGNENEKKITQ